VVNVLALQSKSLSCGSAVSSSGKQVLSYGVQDKQGKFFFHYFSLRPRETSKNPESSFTLFTLHARAR
jgi:hypothetical protein